MSTHESGHGRKPQPIRLDPEDIEESANPILLSTAPRRYAEQLYIRAVNFANEEHYFGEFSTLHAANILNLQNKLAKFQSRLVSLQQIKEEDAATLTSVLKEYSMNPHSRRTFLVSKD